MEDDKAENELIALKKLAESLSVLCNQLETALLEVQRLEQQQKADTIKLEQLRSLRDLTT